ncbi:hypothetical protein AB0Y04_04740 [Loigolactobacillus coryniformis]|uniref:hypothetical protein n=1 Tax=Loigolactobacillus coryniformis TaxID=1610 RepID=UPI003F267243
MNYKIYQGAELKQTVTSKTAVMNGLQPNKTYEFGVEPDNVLTGSDGNTRYLHVAYANSSDDERNMNNWVLSDPAKQATKITYKDGVNTIDFRGVGSYEVFNFPVKAEKGQSFSVSFSWTQPDIIPLDSRTDGVPVSITDEPMYSDRLGRNVICLGVSKTNSKLFTISGTATADKTYISINLGYLADGIPWQFKASFQQDFSQDANNHEYIGTYTDLTQADSTNPSDYTWSTIKDGDAIRDGTKETISVTTRGIRFNIPKTLTVGSTITLRYEEYPLGIVPIGNEPSGYFGGGNKQNLSAKVISTANGSSVVEVAGNVIDVGGANLITNSYTPKVIRRPDDDPSYPAWTNILVYRGLKNNETYTFSALATVESPNQSAEKWGVRIFQDNGNHESSKHDFDGNTGKRQSFTFMTPDDGVSYNILVYSGGVGATYTPADLKIVTTISDYKLELGDIATPYASFVDGSTFTAQADGTFALFSEYKALYY